MSCIDMNAAFGMGSKAGDEAARQVIGTRIALRFYVLLREF
jgi:hypothetical protein